MKIYKVYREYYGCDDPESVYTINYDKAIQIFNDMVREECKNSPYDKVSEEIYRSI